MTISNVILICTTVCVGLMAGLFFSFSYSVVLGLGRLSNADYISAMQHINRAIQNPVFFIIFLGSLILVPLCAYKHFSYPVSTNFWLLLAASILYLIGAFGTTVFGNIPLNNSLDKFDLTNSSLEAINLQRTNFEAKWNNLNIIRTVSSVLSFILFIVVCIYSSYNSSLPKNL
ncbi:MAG: anthrone oxygenase family protein [Ferruginibacter sp.]